MTPTTVTPSVLRIGARESALARAQADQVASWLNTAGVPTEFVGITTRGDTDQRPLTQIGGTGIFASAVRDRLLDGTIDLAVHSLKDLPTAAVDGLTIAAVPTREDTRDVLVGVPLEELRDGLTIGTGAPRRTVQLTEYAKAQGLDLQIVPIRGNVGTRLDLVRSGQVDAVVLAAAGLRRLGLLSADDDLAIDGSRPATVADLPASLLSLELMLPAPGQGALALEIATDLRPDFAAVIATLDDQVARAESLTERSFLATLEAGCTAPVGARAVVKSVRGTSLDLTLAAVIGRTLGSNSSEPAEISAPIRLFRHVTEADPQNVGQQLARQVLAQLPTTQ